MVALAGPSLFAGSDTQGAELPNRYRTPVLYVWFQSVKVISPQAFTAGSLWLPAGQVPICPRVLE
jgi:hypothetical protein